MLLTVGESRHFFVLTGGFRAAFCCTRFHIFLSDVRSYWEWNSIFYFLRRCWNLSI